MQRRPTRRVSGAGGWAAGVFLGIGVTSIFCLPLPGARAAPDAKSATARQTPSRSPAAAVASSNAFGFALYAQLRSGQGNVICSPASAAIALTMAWAGARGATQREMTRVLALGSATPNATHRAFAALLHALDDPKRDRVTLHVADRLWGQKGLPFHSDYLRLLAEQYGAPLESVDFANATDQARGAINRWAAAATHDRIPALLGPEDLSPETRLVLTNAIYLKAEWVNPFSKPATSDGPFTTSAAKINVPMMHEQVTTKYARLPDAQLVELDYRGDLSMVVILPDDVNGLETIEGRLAGKYQAWMKTIEHKFVDVALPRWTVRSRLALSNALAAMGMATAFSTTADFSGIASSRSLSVQQALQEAFVNVDEEGTEAAAVTAIAMKTTALTKPLIRPIPFHADHPFLYLIRDQKTGAILFVGRIVDPR